MRPQRPCIEADCGNLHRNAGPRCGPHERAWQKQRNASRPQYAGNWKTTSKKAREEQPFCSVCGTPYQLTLDHETGTVQCKSCNSSHRRNIEDTRSV